MSKKTKGESTRSQRLTIESLEQFGGLAGFAPPTGDFDPAGTWSHTFRLWMVSEKGGHSSQDIHYRGLLQITRKPLIEEKAISFEVRQAYLQDTHTPSVHDTQAKLLCADDALASPRRWTLRHTILDAKLVPVPQTEINQSGEIQGTAMQLSYAGHSVQRQVPERLSCNWSVWDAIQRLPRTKTPVEFALLEELDLLKLGQRVDYCGPVEQTVNGKKVSWHCFQHVGRGLLPYHYYLDQQGRLLLAIGGERAYIYDPKAPAVHQQQVALMARRKTR